MHILHVHVRVKPDCVDAFRTATLENARHSLEEAGIARFDVCQQQDDPTRFVLVEAYRSREDHAAHRGTSHYRGWRDTVAGMMAEDRKAHTYTNLFPADSGW
ncbi:MAG: putative quinol monooxygenase [Opitutaceae bacterium]